MLKDRKEFLHYQNLAIACEMSLVILAVFHYLQIFLKFSYNIQTPSFSYCILVVLVLYHHCISVVSLLYLCCIHIASMQLFLPCLFVHVCFLLYFLFAFIPIQMRVLKNDFSRYNVVEEEAHEIGMISSIITAHFDLCSCGCI